MTDSPVHNIALTLALPEDMSLERVFECARRLRLTPDEFISRCVAAYTLETIELLDSGELQRWIEVGRAHGVNERIDRV